MESCITFKNLSIGYRQKHQLRVIASAVSASLQPGELTCLIGANGVGKSTLLRTLCGFQPALDGEILLQDQPLSAYPALQLARQIGVVLTSRVDVPQLSVKEIVGIGRSPYTNFWGTLTPADQQIVDEAIHQVGIRHLAQRNISELSDGERQKTMIAKALAQQTRIIILDEPTAFLDFPSKVEIMQLLHHLTRKTNKTIFMSTHDLELALQISDKIWLMDKANGISTGTPEDLALSGHLSNFFARKGIVFDKDTGLFRIDNQFSRQIRLVGHGQKYAMVRKALQRNGILANREVESNIWIETGDLKTTHFIIHETSGSTYITQTIEELLAYFDTEKS